MPDHPSNRPSVENLGAVFTFHPPGENQKLAYQSIRSQALTFTETILRYCPPCADTSSAIRKVREAVMTANASIALSGPFDED